MLSSSRYSSCSRMTSHIAPLPDCFVDDGIVMCQVMRGAPCSRVNDSLDPQDTRRRAATNDPSHRKNVAAEARCSRLSRERFSALAHGFFGSSTILPSKSEAIWITADMRRRLVPVRYAVYDPLQTKIPRRRRRRFRGAAGYLPPRRGAMVSVEHRNGLIRHNVA